MGLQLNIFLVRNFFINNRCCRVMHAATLKHFPYLVMLFAKKGYSSHCRVLSFLGFFSHCGPKELKSFNINRAYLSFLDS